MARGAEASSSSCGRWKHSFCGSRTRRTSRLCLVVVCKKMNETGRNLLRLRKRRSERQQMRTGRKQMTRVQRRKMKGPSRSLRRRRLHLKGQKARRVTEKVSLQRRILACALHSRKMSAQKAKNVCAFTRSSKRRGGPLLLAQKQGAARAPRLGPQRSEPILLRGWVRSKADRRKTLHVRSSSGILQSASLETSVTSAMK